MNYKLINSENENKLLPAMQRILINRGIKIDDI